MNTQSGRPNLIHLLADIVHKNGNLLLHAGPMADGTIPALRASRLPTLGTWLQENGEAMDDTRPWEHAAGETAGGGPERFTSKDGAIYVILLGQTDGNEVTFDVGLSGGSAAVSVLGEDRAPESMYEAGRIKAGLGGSLAPTRIHVFKVEIG